MKSNGTRYLRVSRRRARVVLSAAALSALLVGGFLGPTAFALWNARVTVSGSVTVASLGTSASWTPDPVIFLNSSTTRTALVTIQNTTDSPSIVASDTRADLSVSSAVNSGITVTAWPTDIPTDCSDGAIPPSDAASGPWTDGLTLSGNPVRPGAQTYLCVQTTGSMRAFGTFAGTQTLTPTVAVTLSTHNLSASASASASFTTQWMYMWSLFSPGTAQQLRPDTNDNRCLDAGATMDQPVVIALCQGTPAAPQDGQWIRWTVGTDTDFQILTIGRAAGGFITLDPDGALRSHTTGGIQNWQVQAGVGFSQIVSQNGLCMTAPATTGPMTARACDGSSGQNFAFIPVSR